MSKHAIIVGGGVAGPTLALFLKKIGITSTVYESYSSRKDLAESAHGSSTGDVRHGGGFQIAPNGMNVLKVIGLSDTLISVSAISEYIQFVSMNGKLMGKFRNGRPEVNGVQAVNTTRHAMLTVLIDALEKEGLKIEFGKRLSNVTFPAEGQVEAHFEDGTSARGDFIVGADGMRSRTRSIVFPDAPPPLFAGHVGYGGVVPMANTDCAVPATTLTFVLGRTGQFGYVQLSDSIYHWFMHVPQENEPTKEELRSRSTEEMKEFFLKRCAGWHEPVPSLIRKTEKITPVSIFTLPELPTWHRDGTVVLVGDAAHGMSPSAGLGASMALEDSMALAKLLRDTSSTKEAFQRFEAERRPRTTKIATLAHQRDIRERATLSSFQAWMRDRMMSVVIPLFGERETRWRYEHRIDWT